MTRKLSFTILWLLCSTAAAQITFSPSSVVMGRGGQVTVNGYTVQDTSSVAVSIDDRMCDILTTNPLKFRVLNRKFWAGPKRVKIYDISNGDLIDDGNSGFSSSGTWTASTSIDQYEHRSYRNDYRKAAAGAGEATATWTFSGLSAGNWDVYVFYNRRADAATNAPYTVKDGATPLSTINVDQTVEPADSTWGNDTWHDLGEFTITGTTLEVELTNNANGYVWADAIRVHPAGVNGTSLTTVEGKFQVTELRPYGTEVIIWDFEDGMGGPESTTTLVAGPTTYHYYVGDTRSHVFRNEGQNNGAEAGDDGVYASGDHYSPYSFRQEIRSASYPGTNNQIWVERFDPNPGFSSYTEEDGTPITGAGCPIPEAVGCNRMIFDYKNQAGLAWNNMNIGTYYVDPDGTGTQDAVSGEAPSTMTFTDEENNNYHFYSHYAPVSSVQSWRTIYFPLVYTSQRPGVAPDPGSGEGGMSMMGAGATLPVGQNHSISDYIRWQPHRTVTNSPFDLLTRFYFDWRLFFSGGTQWDGGFQWLDDVGFASVDDKIETSPRFACTVTAENTWVVFPFSVENTHATLSRNFYTNAAITGSYTYDHAQATQGLSNYFLAFESGEGIYHDVNANGEYDAGTDTAVTNSLNAWSVLSTPIAPGETRHFLFRVSSPANGDNAYAGSNENKKVSVNFIERRSSVGDAAWRFDRGAASRTTPTYLQSDAAYLDWQFIANSRGTPPTSTNTVPGNPTATIAGSDTWVTWDEPFETRQGYTCYFEVDRSDDGVSWAYYRAVNAASPGFIDTGVTNKYYRIRHVNMNQDKSAWSATAQAGADFGGIKKKVGRRRRGVRIGIR